MLPPVGLVFDNNNCVISSVLLVLCNKRLRNYVYCMSRVLWTHLEHSHLISIYIVAHCTYLRDSVIIKNCSSLKCCLCAVRAVRFNYSAVPEDRDLRTAWPSTKELQNLLTSWQATSGVMVLPE